jgi:hypothetical protein
MELVRNGNEVVGFIKTKSTCLKSWIDAACACLDKFTKYYVKYT